MWRLRHSVKNINSLWGDSRPRLSGGAKLRGFRGRGARGTVPANSRRSDGPSWVETKMAIKVTGILGKKVGMTQLFDSKGDVRPVTVLQAGPCVVTQHKSATKDGYEAAQIGLVEFVKESRLSKGERGHLAKNNLPPVKFLREVPLEVEPGSDGADGALKIGDRVLVEIFEGERFVDVVGVSKGRGFQGVVKRHHFAGGPKSHGSM